MKTCFTLILLLGFAQDNIAQPDPEIEGRLRQYLAIQHQRLGFNGVLLIARDTQVLYHHEVGKASVELDVPITAGTVFRIASVSKSFTGTLIAMAAAEGKLSLHAPLSVFFSELKGGQWRGITVHQLLTHTSGIPHNEGIKDYWPIKSRLPLTQEQALAEIFAMQLLFEPGRGTAYSSPGYFLLACILEKVYSKAYPAILKEKITAPLNMKHTGVSQASLIIPGMAYGYHSAGNILLPAPFRDLSLMKGSGDLYSSTADLMKWHHSFLANTRSRALKALLFTEHAQKTGHNNDDTYGYGWFIQPAAKGRRAYYHGGGSFGCSVIAVLYPEERISLIILSNVSIMPVNELWQDVAKILFKEPFELPALQTALQMSAAQLQPFTGRYVAGQQGQELHIELRNNQLYAKLGANPYFEIYAATPLAFYGKKVNIRFVFQQNDKGNITGFEATGRGQVIHFVKAGL